MANRAYLNQRTQMRSYMKWKMRQIMEAEAERGLSHKKLVVFLVTALQSLLRRKTLIQI